MTLIEISTAIKSEALHLGFDACGIAQTCLLESDAEYLSSWLSLGYHAQMSYMERYFDKRTDPRLLVENARSVVVVLFQYSPIHKQNEDAPQIATYAYGNDYHYIVKSKLTQLKEFINRELIKSEGVCFCDSAPVLERRWAERAGLGWIGKNCNLINQKLGSYFFIGELILDVELAYDTPVENRCGTCTRCLEACPTKALVSPSCLDANRCISYLTIENKDTISPDLASRLSGYAFGCDICQDVCPWNKKAAVHHHPELEAIPSLLNMSFDEWKGMSKSFFNRQFKYSPLKRAGYKKIMNTISFLAK